MDEKQLQALANELAKNLKTPDEPPRKSWRLNSLRKR
ncbi:transposase [Escherichia coli]|nr:transposase [Escherichia coli]